MEETNTTQNTSQAVPNKAGLVKKFSFANKSNLVLSLVAILVVGLGVVTGWLLTGRVNAGGSAQTKVAEGAKNTEKEAGLADESTFKDTATGVLEDGGISGEGTHHLVRDGGPSQYVYLTSTVIDLESFKGKKVQVWGATMTAKKAGWLMDVGKIKVVE